MLIEVGAHRSSRRNVFVTVLTPQYSLEFAVGYRHGRIQW